MQSCSKQLARYETLLTQNVVKTIEKLSNVSKKSVLLSEATFAMSCKKIQGETKFSFFLRHFVTKWAVDQGVDNATIRFLSMMHYIR